MTYLLCNGKRKFPKRLLLESEGTKEFVLPVPLIDLGIFIEKFYE
jgi:hypothetical protein